MASCGQERGWAQRPGDAAASAGRCWSGAQRGIRRSAPLNSDASAAKPSKGAAAGNGASGSGKAEGILVADVLLLLVVGRVLGEAMQRIGQPALMGHAAGGHRSGAIAVLPGLALARGSDRNSSFRPIPAQKGMIDGLSQVGILMLLLLTGMETDLKLVRRSGFAAMAIALCGIAFPFACGFLVGQFGPASLFGGGGAGRLVLPSLFPGHSTALSISSIKIVAMVVREMNFMRRNLGQIIVATAIMEDTVGWVIIAITFGIAGAGGGKGCAWPGSAESGEEPWAAWRCSCFSASRPGAGWSLPPSAGSMTIFAAIFPSSP